MSYCRFSEGDVYMYPHTSGVIQCCSCRLSQIGTGWFADDNFKTHQDALAHLEAHIAAGHNVPQEAIERLREEIGERNER
jgi:hypothetical protein